MEVSTGIREEDGKTQVTVNLTADEVKPHIDAFFKKLSKNRIPGFRPGKAPRRILEQNFGGHEYIYAQISTDLVNDVVATALDSQDIIFITEAEFDEENIGSVEDGKPYSFVVYGEVKPTVELSSYDPVEIKMPPEEATDAEIDFQLESLRGYYLDIQEVDRAATADDYAVITIEAAADGTAIESLNSTDRLVSLEGTLLPQPICDEVVGMKAGDSKEFTVQLDSKDYPEAAGKDVAVKVSVSAVRANVLPELDDDFAKKAGFDDMDALRKEIADQIVEQKGEQLPTLKEQRVVRALAERIEGDIAESYVDFTRQDILHDFFHQLQHQGATFDQFLAQQGITPEAFQKDLDEEAKENAEETLALDALYNHLDLEVTEDDIAKEFEVADDPKATRKAWEEAGRMSVLREAIRRQKATKWLVENAVVTIEEAAPADDQD